MSEQAQILKRAREAATAMERLRRVLAGAARISDPVTVAYLERALSAAATVADETETDRSGVEPASAYLGPLRHRMNTTADLYG